MKCTNKKRRTIIICLFLICIFFRGGCSKPQETTITEYESEYYNKSLYHGKLFAKDLCTVSENVTLDGFTNDDTLFAAGLFDVKNEKVLYAWKVHERIYPASTTKLLTAYVTLKYGNLDDIVTVGPGALEFEQEAQLCGLQEGDQLTLYDLLCGLLLYSGNDCAVAIAEYLSGSVEAFCGIMNQEAWEMGATQTHFVNPHGLHDTQHYTTAYDLYLIFNECIKDRRFLDIISLTGYTASITGADGSVRTAEWIPTNFYSAGLVEMPEGINVIGGKTGTTDEAGACVILFSKDMEENPYISIIMGAADKPLLYQKMTELLLSGVAFN